jgi:hypothetical protein
LLRVLSPVGDSGSGPILTVHERLLEALRPWAIGRSLNFMFGEHSAEQIRAAYTPADYQRLTELKAAYDPTNTFRYNHNLPPAPHDGVGATGQQ